MAKLTALLFGVLAVLIAAYAELAPSYAPLLNWLGPVLGVPLRFLVGLAFLLVGSPLDYWAVLASWVAVGLLIGLLSRRGSRGLFLSVLVYGAAWLFLLLTGITIVFHLFPSVSSLSSLQPSVSPPPAPPGTNLASILDEPIFNQLPKLVSAVTAQEGVRNLLGAVYSSSNSIVAWMAENFAIVVGVATLSGYAAGRVSRSVSFNSKMHRFRAIGTPAVILLLIGSSIFAPVVLSPFAPPPPSAQAQPSLPSPASSGQPTTHLDQSTSVNDDSPQPSLQPTSGPLSVLGAAIAPSPATSVTIQSAPAPLFCSFATLGQCSTWYLYAAADDGTSPVSQAFLSFAQDYNVTNQAGQQSLIFGYSQSSNTGSVSASSSASPTVGGIAISGSADGDNPYPFQLVHFENTGQNFISGNFTLLQNSFVVFVAGASDTHPAVTMQMEPDNTDLLIDAVSTTSGGGSLIFADASYLTPQNYNFSIDFSPGSDSSDMAAGVALYAFPLSVTPHTVVGILSATGPESGGTFITVLGVDLSGATGVQFADGAAPEQVCGLVRSCHVDTVNELTSFTPPYDTAGAADVKVVINGVTTTSSCPIATPALAADCSQFAYYPETSTLCNAGPITLGSLREINANASLQINDSSITDALEANFSAGAEVSIGTPNGSTGAGVCATWVNGKLQDFHISLTFSEEVELTLSADTTISGDKGVSLGDYELGVVLLGLVPVFIDFQPTLNLSASVQDSLTYTIKQGINYTYTLSYNAANAQPLTETHTQTCLDTQENPEAFCTYFPPAPTPDVRAEVNATLGLGLSFLVFDLAGFTITPSVQAILSADTDVNPTTCGMYTEGQSVSPWWGACLKVNLAASAGLDVFGFGQVGLYSGTLYGALLAGSESAGTPTGLIAVSEGSKTQMFAYMAGTSSSTWPPANQPTWSVSPQTDCGSITSSGLYSAPGSATTGDQCEITASFTQSFLFFGGTYSFYVSVVNGPVTTSTTMGSSGSGGSGVTVVTAAPTVTAVSPDYGSGLGGSVVYIEGAGLLEAQSVDFGPNNPSPFFNAVNSTLIEAALPPGYGQVNVTVSNVIGTSPFVSSDLFTYVTITGFTPTTGPDSGGTTVTFTGQGFAGDVSVSFGGNPATDVNLVSPTTITAVTPHGVGLVPAIMYIDNVGIIPVNQSDIFTYPIMLPSNLYLETVLSEVNPDGSATSLYAFLTDSVNQTGGLISNSQSISTLDFMAVFSEKGGLTLLPSFDSSALSQIEAFVPSTLLFLGNTGNCSQTQSAADQASASVSSTLKLTDLTQLLAVPLFPELHGALEEICLRVYESAAPLNTVGPRIAESVLPSIHQTGLINVLEQGLVSGALIPGSNSASVNATMLVAGYSNYAFLNDFLVLLGATSNETVTSSGLFGFAGALTVRDGAVHSSGDVHTTDLAQLLGYSGTLSFAPGATFSEVGVGSPNNSTSSDLLPDDSMVVVTNSGSPQESIFQQNQIANATQAPVDGEFSPSGVQTSFGGLFPADLQISKSFSGVGGGDVRVDVLVKNLDSSAVSIISLDDSAFLSSYRGGAYLVSGITDNNTATTLSPGQSTLYSYVVGLTGSGQYLSEPAQLSYEMDGQSFSAQSNPVLWTEQGPDAFTATANLIETVGGTFAQAAGHGAIAPTLIAAALLALFVLAGFMEYRSTMNWWRLDRIQAEKVMELKRMLESNLITPQDYDAQLRTVLKR